MGAPLWAVFGFGGILLLAIVAVLFSGARPEGSVPTSVRFARIVAVIYAGASGLGVIWSVAYTLMSPAIEVVVPVQQFWPALPDSAGVVGTTATVVGGGVTEATLELEGLGTATRVLLASGQGLQGLLGVCLGMAVAVMCTGLIKQVPFRPMAVLWVRIAGAATIICGLGWQLLGGWGSSLAAHQVLWRQGGHFNQDITGWEGPEQILGMPLAADSWSIDFWPIWVGLALLALSLVLRNGLKLQKETAGLI